MALSQPLRGNSSIFQRPYWSLISGVVTSVIMGILAWAAAHLFYLIFVYPLLMSFGVSVLTLANYFQGNFKNLAHLTRWACIFGLIAYGTYRTSDYLYARWNTATLAMQQQGVDATTAYQNFDDLVKNNGGSPGILGYWRLQARYGQPFNTKPVVSIQISEVATWLYWLLEVLIVSAYSARLSRKVVLRKPTA